jgi:peptidoglycan/LPS O-acetylase OafA/YrhL
VINLGRLDALRGLLATYVLAGHCRWLLWEGHAAWLAHAHSMWEVPIAYASALLRFGHEAVMVFFALSGFFIHLRFAQGNYHGRPISVNPRDFYRRRFHRLCAPYLFALMITVVCDAFGWRWFPRLYESSSANLLLDQSFFHKGYSWRSIVPAMMFLPSSLAYDFGSNGPLWSLSYEVVYYALYPG